MINKIEFDFEKSKKKKTNKFLTLDQLKKEKKDSNIKL